MTKSAVGGVFGGLLIAIVSNFMLLIAALGFALRYLGVVVLTLVMPILGVLWSLDTWPLSTTAEIARKAAAIYPGLVLAGLPAAFLFRIGFLWDVFGGASGLWDLLLALMFIPTACVASLLTIYWSAPAVKTIAAGGAAAGTRAPRSLHDTAQRGRAATGRALEGGRGVHRWISERRPSSTTDADPADATTSPSRTTRQPSSSLHASRNRTPDRRSPDGNATPALPSSTGDDDRSSAGVIRVPTHRLQRANRRFRR